MGPNWGINPPVWHGREEGEPKGPSRLPWQVPACGMGMPHGDESQQGERLANTQLGGDGSQ